LLSGALYQWLLADLPDLDELEGGMNLPSTRIYDRHGALLYEIVDLYDGRHQYIALEALPPCLLEATIATEDQNFYQHPGVDVEGVARALWLNLRGQDVRAGGSTITQQVARTLLLQDEKSERTARRKLREMILAIELNRRYTRDEILELYLNFTYYGNLAYGVEAAAYSYFGHSAQQLSLAQCALLAGLAQSPALYNPLTDPQAAQARQEVVLGLMVKAGYISQEQADIALAEDIQYAAARFPIEAPHFVTAIWTQLERDYPDELRAGGLHVTTTLDLGWQWEAERIANQHLAYLNAPPDGSPPKNAHNAALVAMNPRTGEILAMLGSPDYFDESIDGNVNAALAKRQPGSALKPFTYAAAFDPTTGHGWTAASMVLDIGTPFVTRRLESYTPSNYGLVEHGPVSIREALASSYNIPAVYVLNDIGVDDFIALTTRLGISTMTDSSRYDLSVTLGGGEVRLVELTAAYAAFANQGHHIDPVYILKIEEARGRVIYEWQPPLLGNPELDPRVAFLMNSILSDEAARYPSFGANSSLSIGARPAAAKTGTTTDFRDNWTLGYTPQLVVGVWVGNADNTPMIDVSGVSGAGPIWNQFIRAALADEPYLEFPVPEGLERVRVCALSGLLPTPDCPAQSWEWFITGTAPTDYDTFYQRFALDSRTGLLADETTPPEFVREQVFLILPPEARTWAAQQGIPAPPLGSLITAFDEQPLRLLNPDPYTVFQLTPFSPYETQRIRLSVAAPSDAQQVFYWLGDDLIGTSQTSPFEVWWPLEPGRHELFATALLADKTVLVSEHIPFRVNSWVPPDERPTSGEAE
jgi:penicillin-binding protein 1C